MIIIVTNKKDYTADFLVIELNKRHANYVRFNTEDFPQQVKITYNIDKYNFYGFFSFPKQRVFFKDIKSIWYRRPVSPVPSSDIEDPVARDFVKIESQATLDGIWRCLNCFWVSNPDNLRKSELKLYQLKVARRIGFILWPTILTNIPEESKSFYYNNQGDVIYKPLRCGRGIWGQEFGGNLGSDPINCTNSNPSLLGILGVSFIF